MENSENKVKEGIAEDVAPPLAAEDFTTEASGGAARPSDLAASCVDAHDGAADNAQDEPEDSEPAYQPKNRYEKLLYRVYRDESLAEMLKISSYAIVLMTAYAFFVRLLALIASPTELIKLLAVTGAPFVLVSLMRRFINAPRPYELLEFYKRKPKGKEGKSFPSRHVFSVFIIATVLIPTDPLLSAALFAAGALLAFLRVALGIHFVRDVVAGALIGAATGGIGLLVLHLV